MKMPNVSETIERLAREAEARRILEMLMKCKDLQEAIDNLIAMLNK